MRDFKASEQVFLCDECGMELKVLNSVYDEEGHGWELELECRECGPQGIDWIYE